MSMLYIHVPFCRTRCLYCDFYSTTLPVRVRESYLRALVRELSLRRSYLPAAPLSSVYVGGGTPSILSPALLRDLFSAVTSLFTLAPGAEVTLEANPDDVTEEFLRLLPSLPVNRLSLGVQTFNDRQLRRLRRRHDAACAVRAVRLLHEAGVRNLSVDLIYALPGQTLSDWRSDLLQALSLPVTHLSAYALSYEPSTPLHRLLLAGIVRESPEALQARMYALLRLLTRRAGFVHYEISNFSLPHFRSRHNSGYWADVPYLGVGPSAHSYDLLTRRANLPDLRAYVRSLLSGRDCPHRIERLTPLTLRNETVMKSLRTLDGIDLSLFARRFSAASLQELLSMARPYIRRGDLLLTDRPPRLRLAPHSLFVSDSIIGDLFVLPST